MTVPTHRRALCPHCKRVCEQRSTTELVGGVAVPSRTCIECLTTYADDPRDEPPPETVPNGCPLCKSGEVVHRVVRDPSGAELPAVDCADCEQLCLSVNVATVRAAYAKVADLEEQLRAADTARQALSQQLLLCERKVASLRPPQWTLEAFKADDSWQAVFEFAGKRDESREWSHTSGNANGSKPHRVAGSEVSEDVFGVEDIDEVIAASEGANDGPPWVTVVRLKDGRWAFLEAGCDYTGWDCHSHGGVWVSHSLDNLKQFGLTDEARSRLRAQLDEYEARP